MNKNSKIHRLQEDHSPQLFQNKWLDKFTRTHIAVPVSLFFLYAGGLLYYTKTATALSNGLIVFLFFWGWLLFSFTEYWVHRKVYHLDTKTERQKRFVYTMHGVHHDHPKDKQRLAMPPVLSVAIATVLLGLFRLVLGDYGFSTLAGFLVGYAFYLLVHYSVHIFRSPNNFLRVLWTNHAIHHYGNQDTMFGVSSPLWDYVFGTLPRKKPSHHVQVNA